MADREEQMIDESQVTGHAHVFSPDCGPWSAVRIVLIALFFTFPALTAEAAVITAVEFRPGEKVAGNDLAGMVSLRQGEEFSALEMERSRRLLEGTGLFQSVEIRVVDEEGGKRVVVEVTPYRLVEEVDLAGNFLVLKKNLLRGLRLRVGDPYRSETVREDIENLLDRYVEEGFTGTEIAEEAVQGKRGVRVTYRISEGRPVILREIRYEGVNAFSEKELSPTMRMAIFTFFNREGLQESLDRLRRLYRRKGYLDVKVSVDTQIEEGIVPPALTLINPVKGLATILPGEYRVANLVILVNEGRRYEVLYEGLTRYVEKDMEKVVTFYRTGFFDEFEAGESARGIRDFFRRRGYFHADAEYDLDHDAGRVTFRINEGEIYRVKSVRLEGVSYFDGRWLRGKLSTKTAGPAAEGLLRKDFLDKDVKKIREIYRDEGFMDIEVEDPAVDLDFSEEGAEVVFSVEEGIRTVAGNVSFKGISALDEDDLLTKIKWKANMPYLPSWVTRAKEKILIAVSRRGYPHCRVAAETRFSADRSRVDITFIVEEGSRRRFGEVIVVGSLKTRNNVIRREVPAETGDLYSLEYVAQGKRNLYGLGYFEEVNVILPEPAAEDAPQDLIVKVRERKTGVVSIGAGWASEELWRGYVEIGESNLFGKGRGISARAKVSTIERRYDLFYREPWPFGYRLNSEGNVFEEFRDEDGYDLIRRGVNLGVKKIFRRRYHANLRYRFEFVDYKNIEPAVVEEEGDLDSINITSVSLILGYDRRDNPVFPHRGSFHTVSAELATPLLGGDTSFNKYEAETSWYVPFGEKSEFALSLQGGIAENFGLFRDLPLSERFFLGGARGVRGYPERDVGPKDRDGDPLGGDLYGLAVAEFRFTLKKDFRGVFFVDSGNVWRGPENVDLSSFKTAIGAGLRYDTPVGPVRLDYGHKLHAEEDEAPGRLHFSIGYPF